ncbi:MAG: capsule assembly Wzi family protein [Microscillaceae bacterium]|nr:capsule assembly Wzi family protein [Microscillaceae bacterium]MDW8459706.1 capsule assembly Wzi family protein [Cytophagales bacterium]
MKKNLVFWLFTYPTSFLFAQSVFVPTNQDYSHLIERYEIRQGKFAKMHTHMKPLSRKNIVLFAENFLKDSTLSASQSDKFNLQYLISDSWEWATSHENNAKKPILKYFYQKKSDLYQHQEPNKDFDVHVNPVLYLSVGKEQNYEQNLLINTRGVEVRGYIAEKVGFYAYMADNILTLPQFVNNRIIANNAVMGEGYYKREPLNSPTVSLLTGRGYITFEAIKNIAQVQFGYDRNFIGNGYRSLILSDFSSNYLFAKLNTQVWKINYQNLFAQMNADVLNADGNYPRKYFALHHLSMNITPNFNIGIFESVVFGRSDSLSQTATFDFHYLNPIIFYRSMEQQLGSPDNANLGLDFKYHFLKRFALYGQLFVDEFRIQRIRQRTGWWGNKQAWQLGLKYIDVLNVKNLDLQIEWNAARPYTYSHNSMVRNYAHYRQPLAHPLGANFYELISILRYQPLPRLQICAKTFVAQFGLDENNLNWGQNILADYRTFVQEFGNRIGQGLKTDLVLVDFTISFQIKHNLFIDLKQLFRQQKNSLFTENTTLTSLALRWNIPQRLFEF